MRTKAPTRRRWPMAVLVVATLAAMPAAGMLGQAVYQVANSYATSVAQAAVWPVCR